ncbi:9066_t:CDS:2 [Ambispora gerdemannii]|uniref:9066_t:CDS:1 n=1 Tax=Ambispora gerdemannii TaxID=144530 RepID=A0A9N9G8R6_9GLOM|nr:9066_t:CDS:2 [Ambispora gerdemannii]
MVQIRQTPTEILHLYRSFLRLGSRWPKDHLRPDRNLKKVIESSVTEKFRKNSSAQEPEVLNLLFQEAERELDALKRLLDNEFRAKYPLSKKIASPVDNPTYYSGLMVAIDKAVNKKLQNSSNGIFAWYKRK